jgi:hypothetical protein
MASGKYNALQNILQDVPPYIPSLSVLKLVVVEIL